MQARLAVTPSDEHTMRIVFGAGPLPHALAVEAKAKLTPEQQKARRARNIALALCIGGLCILFFAVTIFRLGGAVLQRAM